jgi:hypothetical protein
LVPCLSTVGRRRERRPTVATLDEIKAWRPAVLAGKDLADTFCPDSDDSAGGKFLADVRDAVVEAIEYGTFDPDSDARDNDNGEISQIADSAPDVYTYNRWQEFGDLGAYQEEPEITGEWPGDLTEAAGLALYQIAERLAYAILREWREGLEEARDMDED